MFIQRVLNKLHDFPVVRRSLRFIYFYLKFILNSKRGRDGANYHVMRLSSFFDSTEQGCEYFFGYYDKSPWSPTDSDSLLCHRKKNNSDELELYLIRKGQAPEVLGRTTAWTYQQGAMLQWMRSSIIYNVIRDEVLGAEIISGSNRVFLPWPVQSIHPYDDEYVAINYLRLKKMNAEYAYNVCCSNFSEDMGELSDGLWKVDVATKKAVLIVSLGAVCLHQENESMNGATHGINHAMYSNDGEHIVFMHRWVSVDNVRYSRMYSVKRNGKALRLLLDDKMVSHYSWTSENHLVVYASYKGRSAYYYVNIDDGSCRLVHESLHSYGDGHPTLSPMGKLIVSDTYPDDSRRQTLFLYDVSDNKIMELGRFLSPVRFEYERRCDLHPRWNKEGNKISFDSACSGVRDSYVMDLTQRLVDGEL